MNNWSKKFGGSNSPQVKEEVQSVNEIEPKKEDVTITMTPSELDAYLDRKLEQRLKEVKPTESKIVTQIRNENYDDIPQLRNFEPKERIYVLVDGTKPISRGLQTRHKQGSPLQYLNPETRESHALFYSLTETSFFKDKHKGDAKVEHISFKDGMLNTYEDDIKLQKFLAIHPGNVSMGGHLFEEYNPSKKAEVKLEDFQTDLKARNLASEMNFIKQDAVARLLCSDYKETWSPAELKQALFNEVIKQPNNFIKLANDSSLEMKGVAKTALQRGIISYKNYKFFNDKGDVICEVGRNQNEFDAIVDYFGSGQGLATFEFLKNSIG